MLAVCDDYFHHGELVYVHNTSFLIYFHFPSLFISWSPLISKRCISMFFSICLQLCTLFVFWVSHMKEIMSLNLCVSFFFHLIQWELCVPIVLWMTFTLLYSKIVLHCVYFLYHSFFDGLMWYFQDLGIMSCASINIGTNVSLQQDSLILSGRYQEGEQLDWKEFVLLAFWRIFILISIMVILIYIPMNNVVSFSAEYGGLRL